MSSHAVIPNEVKALNATVAVGLREIEPSVSACGLQIFPCEAVLDDGTVDSLVYVVEAVGYIREWGVWPWQDSGKRWIPAERIRSVRSSPLRLAPRFANTLNSAGESGMGYCAFSVDLRDGRRLFFITGNAMDFPCWPNGVSPADVVAVHAHDRHPDHRRRNPRADESSASYAWSPFRSVD